MAEPDQKLSTMVAEIPVPKPRGSPTGDKMEILSSSFQERAETYQRETEIILAGEQLRQRLHNARMIKERQRLSFTYGNCFVANDLISWLIKHKEATDRETAIKIMQVFMDSNVVHHACDEYKEFKDEPLYYRFRTDDGTLDFTEQISIVFRSQKLFEMMMKEEDCILQVREEDSAQYKRAFIGSQVLDWLVDHCEVTSRDDGEKLCKTMLQYGIIQHVSGQYQFSDSDMLYRFAINVRRRRKLIEVLDEHTSSEPRPDSPDSPFCLRKLGSELPRIGFVCENDPGPPPPVFKRSSSEGAVSCPNPLINKPIKRVTLVPKRPVTVEELQMPGKMYIQKTLFIMGDDVGWGFMARGTGPCYIQTMDVGGPAHVAGMKACQFIKSVNGINCLHLDYSRIYKLVDAGPRLLILEVLEPVNGSNYLVEAILPP
ncbi:DEP domain-containing mTOR-interacting protein isoform X1 [Dendrobates tinctorius]|uniref:DEP domain-containing mTOR-interacting protein isoform X1 n=1 Tax=Dendrobates tinctorius TaxID=92724 RepID=UPI003CCA6A88